MAKWRVKLTVRTDYGLLAHVLDQEYRNSPGFLKTLAAWLDNGIGCPNGRYSMIIEYRSEAKKRTWQVHATGLYLSERAIKMLCKVAAYGFAQTMLEKTLKAFFPK